MAAARNRKHLLVPGRPGTEPYTPHKRSINPPRPPPPPDRPTHGRALKAAFEDAVHEAQQRRADGGITVQGAVPGLYVQFESQPGVPLNLTSLEAPSQGIELVAVSTVKAPSPDTREIERATVFVPEGKVKHFIDRFEAYSKTTPKQQGEHRYERMLDPVAALRLATLRSLWTDAVDAYPDEKAVIWWEVWLRRDDGGELARLLQFAGVQGLAVAARRLQFDDRVVTLVRASPVQLAASVDVLSDLAEVRKAKETAAEFIGMSPDEQSQWLDELRTRTTAVPQDHAPAVCVLDTGVNRGHPLLERSISEVDCHTCDADWGAHDHLGHGTEMAGLALYGDLVPLLAGTASVQLRHRLESVKILPPKGQNPSELYGAITAQATSRVEIQAPTRQRCFSMSIAATDERDRGQPTSWSAAIDALAAGQAFDSTSQGLVYLDDQGETNRRLFVLCAGNVDRDQFELAHLDRSDLEPVHDPGQAWNALTVGAYTDKTSITAQDWEGWQPLARAGDLSPWSTTGVTFQKAWPIKPDVVFEGGNLAKNARGELDYPCPDLCLLTTHFRPSEKRFVLSWATSAATAQVARMTAVISAEYPSLWPETVRGLIVQSAAWTPRMLEHFGAAHGKRARAALVQRYGFGVPTIERALRSANDALTLIAQSSIRPSSAARCGSCSCSSCHGRATCSPAWARSLCACGSRCRTS